MKRFHVHLSVSNLQDSIRFYSALFGRQPGTVHADYAKWMLDDPHINFAISQRGRAPGLDHLGFQVGSDSQLQALTDSLRQADLVVLDQAATSCCYAISDKGWVRDPQGIAWESFVTYGASTTYGVDQATLAAAGAACCLPARPN